MFDKWDLLEQAICMAKKVGEQNLDFDEFVEITESLAGQYTQFSEKDYNFVLQALCQKYSVEYEE